MGSTTMYGGSENFAFTDRVIVRMTSAWRTANVILLTRSAQSCRGAAVGAALFASYFNSSVYSILPCANLSFNSLKKSGAHALARVNLHVTRRVVVGRGCSFARRNVSRTSNARVSGLLYPIAAIAADESSAFEELGLGGVDYVCDGATLGFGNRHEVCDVESSLNAG